MRDVTTGICPDDGLLRGDAPSDAIATSSTVVPGGSVIGGPSCSPLGRHELAVRVGVEVAVAGEREAPVTALHLEEPGAVDARRRADRRC